MSRTLYARYTNKDNQVHVDRHQVWDADRFIAARSSEARGSNAKAVKDGAVAGFTSFTVIDEAEYKKLK